MYITLYNKLLHKIKTLLGATFLILTITFGTYFLILNNDHVGASTKDQVIEVVNKPSHSMNYKLGDEDDIKNAVQAFESTYQRESNYIKNEIKVRKEAERKEKEQKEKAEAEKKAKEEKQQVETASNETQTQESQATQQTNNQSTQTTSSDTQNSSNTASTTSNTQTQAQAQPKSAPAPAPQPAPKAAPAPSIGANKIGINNVYRNYSNYGASTTEQYQSGIDSGLIVAGITNFNGNDGQTTYFGGHNPGIMNFIANNIYNGAVITVTDGSGEVFQYKMIDKVDVDEYGEGVLQTIGTSAISAYAYGTGTESILVHFCNTSNNLMSFWYGVKI